MPIYWINGKRVHSDKDLSDEELDDLGGPQVKAAPQESFLGKAWKTATTPPEFITNFARDVSNSLTDPNLKNRISQYIPEGLGGVSSEQAAAYGTGFLGGGIEGLASQATPLNAALTATGMGEASALKSAYSGLRGIEGASAAARTAQNLGRIRQGLSAPVAAHGAINLLHGESTPMERLSAIPEIAGGLLGMKVPRLGGNVRYSEPPPDFGMESESYGQRLLPEGDVIGNQNISPDIPPIRPPVRQMHPDVIEGDVLPNEIPDFNQVIQDRPVPMPNASRFTPEEFGELNQFMGNGPDQLEINNLMRGMTPEPKITDPRMTSIAPEYPSPETMPPSGEVGPPVEGYRSPIAEEQPINYNQQFADQVTGVDPRAIIEEARARARQQVDTELQVSPEEQASLRGQSEIKTSLPIEEGPSFARTETGGIKIGADIRRSAQELTTGYSTSLPGIMVREGMQNALDAVKHQGAQGKVSAKITRDGFEIRDSGRGMTRAELETVFSDLHSSGKTTDLGATGGKGVGKASYMLGGQEFYAETVTTEKGRRIKYTIEGTPEQFMTEVHPTREEVSSDTPTGTLIKTKFTSKQVESSGQYSADTMLENIRNYSRGLTPQLEHDYYGTPKTHKWTSSDRPIASEDFGHSDISLAIPSGVKFEPRTSITVRVLNNGMYQFTKYHYLDEETPNMPSQLIVDIKPKVEEGAPDYPFPVQRESVKDEFDKQIGKLINDKLVNPQASQRKAKLKEIYDNLTIIPTKGGTGRDTVLFDPGDRLTPQEKNTFINNPIIQELVQTFDGFIENVLVKAGHKDWTEKLEGVGIVLDPIMHGVHIPNPSAPRDAPKSIILINPFEHGQRHDPQIAALNTVVTLLHEAAHIGTEFEGPVPPMNPEELNDPRIGPFLQTYIKETAEQGGLDLGHGIHFIKRLGELYAKVGARSSFEAADAIQTSISGESGGYNPGFQRLLSIYKESRGREPVTEDFLSGTGVKQTNAGGPTGNVSGNASGYGTGTPLGKQTDIQNVSRLREAYNLPRGLASVDPPFMTSAGFRQGLPWITSKYWWQAWDKQARAFGSEKAYRNQIDIIERDPLFRPQFRFRGQGVKPIPEESVATQMGLELTDLIDLTRREEVLKSVWAEKIPVYGKYVRASNRAYTAFLNHVRSGAFKDLVTDTGIWDGKRILDVPAAKNIADFVNTTTGRGKLEFTVGVSDKYSKTYNAERAGKLLTDALFSPRLMASRIKMLNPSTYIMAPKYLRNQWMKAMLGTIGAWWTIASLMEMAGAEVGKDPNSSDYGKIKLGNTRLDPGAGFQQYLVAGHRSIPSGMKVGSPTDLGPPFTGVDLATGYLGQGGGGITSSTSGKFTPFGQGYKPETWGSMMGRFAAGKLHPTAKFALDLITATPNQPVFMGDRMMQMVLPLYVSDVAEVLQENPELAPVVYGASGIGMGTQTYEGGPSKPSFTPLLGLEDQDMGIRRFPPF